MTIIITDIANEFETIVRHFNSIESLAQATKEVSVQHGRDILDKLRLMAEEDDSSEERLDIDESRLEMAQMLLIAAKAFLGSMAEIARKDREKLTDRHAAPVFEKTVDAIGRVSYKIRDFVVNVLNRQGKAQEAEEMKSHLEAVTPERFKHGELTVSGVIHILESGIMQADILEKKVTAELRAKKTLKKDAQHIISEVGGYHTIIELNEKSLIPVVQDVRREQEKAYSVGPHRVTEVNKEKLIPAAQSANEGIDKSQDKSRKLGQDNQ